MAKNRAAKGPGAMGMGGGGKKPGAPPTASAGKGIGAAPPSLPKAPPGGGLGAPPPKPPMASPPVGAPPPMPGGMGGSGGFAKGGIPGAAVKERETAEHEGLPKGFAKGGSVGGESRFGPVGKPVGGGPSRGSDSKPRVRHEGRAS